MFFVLKPLKSKHYSTKFIKYIVPLGLGFAFLGLVYFLHLKTGTLIVDYKTPEKENVGQNKKQTLTESPSIEVASLPAKLPKEKDPPWCSTDNYTDLANHPSFEKFNQWVGEWNQIVCPPDILCVHDPRKINNLISKGKSLVKERSLILKRIIRGDPEKAIQLAFPKETISQLPQGIKEHIERWENDIADVAAIHVCFDTKHPKGLINRYVSFPGGRKLKTYVYGNRRNISSKRGVSIWGISLNGEMAMSDKPIQVKRNPQNGRQSIVFDGQELTFTSEVQLKLFEEEIHQLEKKAAFTRTSVSYPMIAASSGLDEYYEKKYDLIETPMTWAEANQTAFESNGRLVIIGSVQENNFIRKLLQKVERGISQGGGAVTYSWIGATDNEDQNGSTYDIENNLSSIIEVNAIEGDWKWLNGEDVNGTYSNWINSTEPNNTDNPDQDFAAMDWSTSAGMWKDLNSSYRLPFVIEYDLGNEPSAISVAVDGYRKVLVVPARFMDEGYSYDGSSSPLVDRQGNPLSPDGQLDSFDPVTPENLAQAMKEVKDFYLRNSDGTFHLEPVISPTVTLPFNKYNKLRGSGEDNLFDTGGGYFTTANITHKELDPLEGLGEVGIVQAAALSSKWDFFGPAFVGVSQITLAQPLVGTGFKKPPTITFSGGNILNGNNDPNFISAEAEAFVNANGEITGIKILNPGAYYHSSPQLLVNGDNALSNQFVIKIDNICVSWVVISTHEPGSPGVGYIGRAGSHVDAGMNGSVSSGTIAHELGHNFGLFHANRYISESEKPNSDEGTFVEYGSPFSVMGSDKDIANYGDFTIPSKVATKKFNGFGLTIGNSIGKDVAEILSPSDLNSSPLKEFGDSSYQSNSNLFRIYRHDYGSAPLPLQLAEFNVSIPAPERDLLSNDTYYEIEISGTGEGAAGFLLMKNQSGVLTINHAGKGYAQSPLLNVLNESNESIMKLDPSWIRVVAGTVDTIQADLRDYSPTALRGLRGLSVRASQFSPIGTSPQITNARTLDIYWLSFRRKTNEYGLTVENGTELLAADPGVDNFLLDMTPNTPGDFSDSYLMPGHTFSDYEADTHITPIGKGGIFPMEYLNVVLNVGTVESGDSQAPAFDVITNTRSPGVGEFVEITASVSDGNKSGYAYSWFTNEKMESDVSFLNQSTVFKSFEKAGQYVVRVIVSDMKGGISSRNIIFNVGEYEKSNRSSISGSVRSNNGFVQGARVIVEKAPIIEHSVSLQGNERDWYLPNGNNDPLRYNIDGVDTPELVFRRGEIHRFHFDESTEGFPLTFFNEPENELARVKINMLVTPMVNGQADGYIESPDVNVSGGSTFSTYASHQIGTIDDFQKGKIGIVSEPLIVTRPYAKALLKDTNVTNVTVRPTRRDTDGLYISYGGVGHDRDNPPDVQIYRSSLWENYNEANATAIAYVDGVGTISPVISDDFLGSFWETRAHSDPIPELVIWGSGSGANATVEIFNKPDDDDPYREIIVYNQGVNFDPNGTMAVLHYPFDPLLNLTFDRHESLFDRSTHTRFQPSPAWNGLDERKLLHYWSFDEEEGTTIYDQVETGTVDLELLTFELSYENRSQWGTKGRAIRFESNETFGSSGTMIPSFPYTVSLWLKPDQDNDFKFEGLLVGGNNLESKHTSPLKREFNYSSSGDVQRSTIHNPWAHIAIVANSATNGSLYVDGLQNSISECVTGNFWPIDFSGLLDEMYVYSKAMTEAQVKAMAGRVFLDLSGNKLHAVPIGPDFNMTEPQIESNPLADQDPGISFEHPGASTNIKAGNSKLGDTFPGEEHGKSIYFNDNDSYIDLSNHITSFSGLNKGSISFWLRTPGTDENGDYSDITVLSASDIDDNESYFRIMVRDTGVLQFHAINDGKEVAKFYTTQASKVRYEGTPDQNDWHHVVFVVDDSKSAFWVDGKQATSVSYSKGTGDARAFFSDTENLNFMAIGMLQTAEDNATNSFHGWLDDFNFYDRALTASEISFLHNLRNGKEQLPRLEAVVDSVGTIKITENGLGYKETPDVVFSYGQEGNLTSELNDYATKTDLENETNTSMLVQGKLAYVRDVDLVYSYHFVRDESDSPAWRFGANNNGWRQYEQAFGKGELNATGVDRVLWTKDTEKLATIQLPDDRNVSRRYLEYVVEESGTYAAPYGLFGYVSPPEILIELSSTAKSATAYALFFIDQNFSAEIINPGRGLGANAFNSDDVRVFGPGYRPKQIDRVTSTDGFGQPVFVDVEISAEEEYGNQARITGVTEKKVGSGDQYIFSDWTADEEIKSDDANTDFNRTLSYVSITDPGFGYSLPVSVSLVGGYPEPEFLTEWVTDGNTTPYTLTPAEVQVIDVDENGTILGFDVVNPGAGYSVPPQVVISGGGGYGARAIADINITDGSITNVGLDNTVPNPGGRGYFNIDSTNMPAAKLFHGSDLLATENDANLSLRLGGSVKEISVCGGCSSGNHVRQKLGTHTETWIEIWDKNRTEAEIDANGDRAFAVAKVKNGELEKIIVINSGRGYREPVVFFRGAGPKHMNYYANGNYENRKWRCVNLRETKSGDLVECGHIQIGLYPPEQCPGEIDEKFPITSENLNSLINAWTTRHLPPDTKIHDCNNSNHDASTHLAAGFKSRMCTGKKVNFVLINDVYRTPYNSWMGFDANASALVVNGKIREILLQNPGAMYVNSGVYIAGTGGEVDAIPVFNDAGLNTQVIFDDPKLKNLEFDNISTPLGAGHGFQERPWSWDMHQEVFGSIYSKIYTPTYEGRENLFVTSVPSSTDADLSPPVSFGAASLSDSLGYQVAKIEVRDFGKFDSTRDITQVQIDFNGSTRPDVDKNGSADFIEATALAHSTTRLTKFTLDHNGTFWHNNGTADDLSDDRWRSLFTEQPALHIIDGSATVSVSPNTKNPYVRLNGIVDYNSILNLGYIDLYIDDRFPEKFFYGFPRDSNSSPAMGGEIIVTEGLPGMNWAISEPNDKNASVYTDQNGFYALPDLEPGLYNVAVFMEDENFQEVTFRPDTNRTHVTEVLYVPGVPDLTIETDGLGFGVSRLIWSKQARELSRPALLPTSITEFNYEQKTLEGIGAGFKIGETPQLIVSPHSQNVSSAVPKLSTSVLVDGSLMIGIIDDVNTSAFYPNDRFTVSYSSMVSGVDFYEDFQFSKSNNSSWAGTFDSQNRSMARLEIFPNDGNGYNAVEVPLSSVSAGDTNMTFYVKAYDENGTMLSTEGLQWSVDLDFNSSDGNNSNVAGLNSPNNNTNEINLTLRSSLRRGMVASAMILSSGSGYSSGSELQMLGVGVGFTGSLIVNGEGRILDINITSAGSGYDSNSQFKVIDENGTGAVLVPVLGGGNLYLNANLPLGGEILASRVKISASSRTQLTPQELWLDRYTDSIVERNASWWASDLDDDGLSNHQEWEFSTNPDSNDTDGDGLSDSAEEGNRTNPNQKDTDSDGLTDYLEVTIYLTNPLLFDTDQDGWSDGYEISSGLDPRSLDTEDLGYISGLFLNTTSLENNVSSYIEFSDTNDTVRNFYKKINLGATSIYPEYFYQNYIPNDKNYTIRGFIDRNGDGSYSNGEPTGNWEGNISTTTGLIKVPVTDPKPYIYFNSGVLENIVLDPVQDIDFSSGAWAEDSYDGILSADTIFYDGNATVIMDLNDGNATLHSDVQPGTYSLNFYALDFLGTKSEIITQNITIKDVIAPTLFLFENNTPTLEAGSIFTEPGFRAFDNVNGDLTSSVKYTKNFESNQTGPKDIDYNVTDDANNSTSTTRLIIVVDTTPPVLILNGSPNVVLEFGDSYVDSNASWVDIVDGSGQVSPNEDLDLNTTGVQLLTFTKTDDNNNTSNVVTRSVTISDTTSPITVLNGNALIVHEAGQTFFDQGANWNDLADGNGTINSQNTVNITTPSIQHISYLYTDQSGNDSNSLTRVVKVVDTTAPILQLVGDSNVTSEVGFSYQDQGAIWTDTVDGNGTVQSTGTVNVQVPGDYNLTYSYRDQAGNPGIDLNRTVHIRDTISPTINFTQDEFTPFNLGDEISFPGVSAIDLYDGNVTSNMTVSEPVGFDSNQTGIYQFTFSASDSSGNITTVQKNIQIVNNTVVLNGLAIDGYLSGARVIFDMDGDGLSDLSQETFTNSKGTFSLLFTMDEFLSVDKNENGSLDPYEGSIIVEGGIDTSTNLPFEGSIISDANSSVVSPLTSLSHALMKNGKTKAEAESLVLTILGIPESVDLSNYDPLAALENGDEQAIHVLRQSTMLANMIKHAGAFANFLEPNDNHSRSVGLILMNEIAKDIAGGVTDIFALENLENNLRKTVEKLDIASNMTAEDLTVASTLIRDSNEAISSSSDDTLNDGFGAVGVFKIQSAIDELILSNYPVDRNASLITVQQLASTQNLFGSISIQKVENIFAPIGSSFTLFVNGEEWKDGVLHEVNASDPEGGVVNYSIIEGNQDLDLDGNNTFSLSENGKLTVHDHDDFILQANQTINLNILLSDPDGKQSFVTGKIELSSAEALNPVQEPVIPEPENLPPVGSSFTVSVSGEDWKYGVLHEMNASDPEGGVVYYSMIDGNQDFDLDGNNTLSLSESGKLSVHDQEDFLLQADRTISLNILLSDSGGKQSFVTGQLELGSVEVLNPVEEPVIPELENLPPVGRSFTVSVTGEDWKNGVLHEMNASDPEGGAVYYSIIDGNQDFDEDGNKTFNLSESGKLTVYDHDDFILQTNQTINLNILLSDPDGKQSFVTGKIELGNGLVLNSHTNIYNNKWFVTDWFGQFFSFESEWLYHSQLGWLYVQLDQTNEGFWFWDPYFQGWWWTSPQVFPYYFISSENMNQWHYLAISSNNLRFYDFRKLMWSYRK